MDFAKQFKDIFASAMTLLRITVVKVEKEMLMFSPDQLTKLVSQLMENLPNILFRLKHETKDYALLLFWPTSLDDSACEV